MKTRPGCSMLAACLMSLALPLSRGMAAEAPASPAERRIAEARRSIEAAPASAAGHVELALALAQRAREVSDHRFYEQAEAELAQAFEREPESFEAGKVRAWVLLGQHRFAEARELAEALNRRVPDDVMVYGLLTDASIELGDYGRAEWACQWMLNLRPGNVPALTRGAYLRELYGDVEGALELMAQALDATPQNETEDRAWILTQRAHLRLVAGRAAEAEPLADEALRVFPGYHYALAQLAKVRAAQDRHEEAAQLLRQRFEAAPHPENLYDLAAALDRAGRRAEAEAAFAEFETLALAESHGADNANHELTLYYADHARRPKAALEVASRELTRRRDVHSLDAYAWALYRSGHTAEAGQAMEQALAVGVREPSMLDHAESIRAKLR